MRCEKHDQCLLDCIVMTWQRSGAGGGDGDGGGGDLSGDGGARCVDVVVFNRQKYNLTQYNTP